MTEQPARPADQQQPAWGGPVPERTQPRWSVKKTAVAAAVAVGIAVGGGFAVYAASGAVADTRGRPGGGMMMVGPGAMNALHGELVVADGKGGYTTQVIQTGEVTALSDTSVTAKSEDGYTKTYTIDADTVRSSVKTGDKVMITATPEGDTATADSITDATAARRGGPMVRQGGPGGAQPTG
ncbi:hypothetical protein [Actinokineospora iranica]|uniref:DUF5666 domain-containing protein n=1 Tax=Actinokineospora iranica TaxID=1271860 RepID=A0A1G6IZN3_9PSEU|nr:hypothetical protein [Actinokineospora iranica]SDC11949.1 hypothetical protein SAMN05216174_101169 [Actinokineospora iranica]